MRTRTRGRHSRTQRRERAAALLQERAKRTPAQQLAKLNREGWNAVRERARLVKAGA